METSKIEAVVVTDLEYELKSVARLLPCFMSMNYSPLVDVQSLIALVNDKICPCPEFTVR